MGLWKRKNNGEIPKLRESLDPIQKNESNQMWEVKERNTTEDNEDQERELENLWGKWKQREKECAKDTLR